MSAHDEYLFDPSAPPDPAVAELEDALRPLAEAPPMPVLPPRGAEPRIVDEGTEVMNVSALDNLPANRSNGPSVALVIGAFVAGVAATLAGVMVMRPAAPMEPAPTPEVAPVVGVEREVEPEPEADGVSPLAPLAPAPDAEPAAKWKQRLGVEVEGEWDRVRMVIVEGKFTREQFPSDELEFKAFSAQTKRGARFHNHPDDVDEYSPNLDPGEYTLCAAVQTMKPLPADSNTVPVNNFDYVSHACESLVVAADGSLSMTTIELQGTEPKLEAKPSGKKGHPGDLKDPFKKPRPQKPINAPDLTDPFKK